MRILRHGDNYHDYKIFVCTKCWCKFEADHKEYNTRMFKEDDFVYYRNVCKCPECGCFAYEPFDPEA